MPNWCNNTLVLRHEDPAMITRAKDAFARGEFCQEFHPCPAELIDTKSPNTDEDSVNELVKKYGYSDWYSFSVNEWGTKWDFGDDQGINDFGPNHLVVYFDSAWSPPIAMMAILEDLGFEVDLMYDEPGMQFCGHYVDGVDDYYDYTAMDADEIDDKIPSELNETFCIAENMRMWEEENPPEDE